MRGSVQSETDIRRIFFTKTIARHLHCTSQREHHAMKLFLAAAWFSLMASVTPMSAFADVSVSILIAPPELPVYEQPILPGDGYIWTPGYWAYWEDDYYWVPGTWVRPPRVGFLWTPGYWMWTDGFFVFRSGYWGTRIGYYGGVNYGYGYGGYGYDGGRWDGGRFRYNRTVNNINITNVHNTYTQTVINNTGGNRVSYNGGKGGTNARPSAEKNTGEREKHIAATAEQDNHEQAARTRPELRKSINHGRPPIAATPKPARFEDSGVVPARGTGRIQGPDKRTDDRARAPARQAHVPATAPRSEPNKQPRNTEVRPEKRSNTNMGREAPPPPAQQGQRQQQRERSQSGLQSSDDEPQQRQQERPQQEQQNPRKRQRSPDER